MPSHVRLFFLPLLLLFALCCTPLAAQNGAGQSRTVDSLRSNRDTLEQSRDTGRTAPTQRTRRSDSLMRVQDSLLLAANTTLARDSMSMESYQQIAAIYKERRQYRSALTIAERMVAVNPYSALANYIYGDILLDNELPDRAIPVLQRALMMEPRFVRARTTLADAYAMRRLFDTALAHLDTAIRTNPRYAQSYLQRAELLSELGRDSAAMEDYQSAGELAPEDTTIWLQLVRLQVKTYRHAEALPVIHYLLSRDTTAEVLLLLADAAEHTGETAEAITAYERFILLFPRHRRALEAERILLRLRGTVYQGGRQE